MLLTEVFDNANQCLAKWRGKLRSGRVEDDIGVELAMADPVIYESNLFSPASMDIDTVHNIFTEEHLRVSLYVMDVNTGVTAHLFNAWLDHQGDLPEPEAGSARLSYTLGPMPVTSMTYAGPPLQAEVRGQV